MPEYLLKDAVFVKRIENAITKAVASSTELDPMQTWDFC